MRLRTRGTAVAATVLSLSMLAAACGSSGSNGGSTATSKKPTDAVIGADDTKLTPKPGGEIKYGLESDTTGGYCLQEAQLAISGMQVARAVYDTLTMPNLKGKITPYLAESVTPNTDYTEWTIKLRPNVVFSDGSKLDADIVRDNLLAYDGKYAKRSPLLFKFVFGDYTKDVVTVDPLTVKVTTNKPWPTYPWFLWSSSRLGITGRAQLDDASTCNKNVVGTGPFKLTEMIANQRITVVRNPNYWQKDAKGVQLPYLDKITFVPITDEPARLTALEAGDINIMHSSSYNTLAALKKQSTLKYISSNRFGEVSYLLLNGTKAPFDHLSAREAVAYAQNRNLANQRLNQGLGTLAQGPFAPGNIGFLQDSGYPKFDLAKAKAKAAQYKQETGQTLSFTYTFVADSEGKQTAVLLQQMEKEAGITVNLNPIGDQSTLINLAIGRQQQAIGWRNHPGADPDTQWVWWHCSNASGPCDNLVNFGGWNDPQINKLLEEGRAEADPAKHAAIYEELNREFAKKLWDLWSGYTTWTIAFQPKVHGIFGPPLPDGSLPSDGLATGHSVLGLWIEH